MEHGYGFYWFPGLSPIHIRPDGKVLKHYVEDMVPYLIEPQGSSFQDCDEFRINNMWIPECALPATGLPFQASLRERVRAVRKICQTWKRR